MAALDAQANDLLAKLDALGTVEPSGEPDCAKLRGADGGEPRAAGDRQSQGGLHAVQARPDAGRAPIADLKAEPKSASPRRRRCRPAAEPAQARAPDRRSERPPGKLAIPRPAAPKATDDAPAHADVAIAPAAGHRPARRRRRTSAARLTAEEEGYTIDEIMAASAGFFGKVSANLGAVIEHLFKKSGRPTGYILGTEGGGAFLAGVRYGKGTLYMRARRARRRSTGTGPRSAPTSAPTAPRRCS